jgi:hypothetical protein
MALEKFTPENVPMVRRGDETLRVNRKTLIAISGALAARLGIKSEDEVIIAQDGKEWFLIKEKGGFKVRGTGSQALTFNCNFLANKILDSLNLPNDSYKFKVAGLPTDFDDNTRGWAILSGSAV